MDAYTAWELGLEWDTAQARVLDLEIALVVSDAKKGNDGSGDVLLGVKPRACLNVDTARAIFQYALISVADVGPSHVITVHSLDPKGQVKGGTMFDDFELGVEHIRLVALLFKDCANDHSE